MSELLDITGGLLILVFMLVLYFLPTLIAGHRDHPKFAGIAILNLLLGWTGLGWVGALIWAVC